MASIEEITNAYPSSIMVVFSREQALQLGHIRNAGEFDAWVAVWFDGTEEPPAIIADHDTPALAMDMLVQAVTENALL